MFRKALFSFTFGLSAFLCTVNAQQLTLWTPDHWEVLSDESRPGVESPNLLMVGGRNGNASAQLAARGSGMLTDPVVEVSPLQHEGGATMPAHFVTVRYGSQHHRDAIGERDPKREGEYFHLSTKPLKETRTLVARLTATIPPNAPPGTYRGQVTVRARGVPAQTLPLTLLVGKGVLPAPDHYVSHVNFLHSPDSVALRYGVSMWSNEHWEKLAESYKVLRALGQSVLWVPVTLHAETSGGNRSGPNHFGSIEGVIRFREEGGNIVPDFSVFEQMLLRWRDQVVKPQFVILYVWDRSFADMERDHANDLKAVVTGVDARGQTRELLVPYPGDSAGEAMWGEVIAGTKRRVEHLGWDPASVLIGMAHDRKPEARVVEFFNKVAPGIQWNVISHMRGYNVRDGKMMIGDMDVAYHEFPWNPQHPENLGNGLLGGWNYDFPVATISRFHTRGNENGLSHRWLLEGTVGNHGTRNRVRQMGPTRFKVEYWGAPRPNGGTGALLNMGGWVNLMRNHTNLGTAGPNGLEPSVYLQNNIESVQDVEARIAIEQMLSDDEMRGKLSDELVARAREVLNERSRFIHRNRTSDPTWMGMDDFHPLRHSLKLYDTLGDMQQAAQNMPRLER
ncbi:MAG: hypothetical protein JJU29_04640 [Verrucomicrobia bacterium]|nr:hypothetical protein [Verrucomicrobiota bacterium]MCH8510174.1 hypothetical protein [Kiritimatiellia bacterium]